MAIRVQDRFVRPLVDLFEVLEDARQGGRRRRRPYDAPREVAQVLSAVNRLLDERARHAVGTEPAADSGTV